DVLVERVAALDGYAPPEEAALVIATDGARAALLFDASRAPGDRIRAQLEVLLREAERDPSARAGALPLLSDEERRRVLHEWNDTFVDYPRDACVHRLFEAQADRTPDAIALVSRDQRLTYRELDRRASQLAHHLRALG